MPKKDHRTARATGHSKLLETELVAFTEFFKTQDGLWAPVREHLGKITVLSKSHLRAFAELTGTSAPFLEQIRKHLEFTGSWTNAIERAMPLNWPQGVPMVEAASGLAQREGIAMVSVPSQRYVSGLREAWLRNEVDQFLEENCSALAADFLTWLGCTEIGPYYYRPLKEAFETLETGQYFASQTLSSSIIEDVFRTLSGATDRFRAADLADFLKLQTLADSPLYLLRWSMTFVAASCAYEKMDLSRDAQPVNFNRHASAHFVSGVQHNRVNALKAAMLGASLVSLITESPTFRDEISSQMKAKGKR